MRALVMLAALLLVALPATAGVVFHVAPDGNDAWSGKLKSPNADKTDGPFATIARARDEMRKGGQRKRGEFAIAEIHGGTYFLPEPLTFDERDSRSAYRRACNEQPIISGGRRVTGFKATPAGLWVAEIPQAKDGKWPFNELFVNGRRRPRARHPNNGYLRVAKPGADKRTSFTFNPGDIPEIEKVKTTELVFLHDWATSRVDLAEIDRQANTLKTADPIGAQSLGFTKIDGFEPHPRYFLENAIEFLDAPGEWFLDTTSGTLTYKPMPGETIDKAVVIAPFLTRLVTVKPDKSGAVIYLDFVGLTFEHCLFVRPGNGYAASQAGFHEARDGAKGYRPMSAAIEVFSGERVNLHECTVQHVGGSGVRFHPSSRDCTIALSTFRDIGGDGIMVGSEGKLSETAPAQMFRIRNNTITRCGQRYFGCVGIWAGIAHSAQIEHNIISDMPYSGISLGWSWNTNQTGARLNRITNNHIHHVMQTLSDGGGIYTLGRQDDTVIAGNLIHDIPPNAGRAESNGMFIDEGSSLLTIEGNAIYRVARSPIRFHRAERDTIRNNVLVSPPGVPTFRYNACSPDTMTIADNRELTPADVPALADGVRGQGLACDGVTAHVDAPHAEGLDPVELTAAAWVKLDAWPPGPDSRRWVVNKNRNEWDAGHWGLIVHGSAVGAYLNIGGGKENGFSAITDWRAYGRSRWNHLAMTYDGKTLRVFVDGKQAADKDVDRPRKPADGHLRIGGRADGYSHFTGTIDDVRLYKRALAADELANLAADPDVGADDKALVRRWTFDREVELPDWLVEARKHAGPRGGQ